MGRKLDSLHLDKTPTWITQDNIEYMKKSDFQRIVRFFVINTPDKQTSARGKEIPEYGVTDEEALFKGFVGSIPFVTKANLEVADITKAKLIDFPPVVLDERVCFSSNNGKPVTGLFLRIRDSLAHGRFNFGGSTKMPYIIMEDINSNGNCSARMILKIATLRSWIEKLEGK